MKKMMLVPDYIYAARTDEEFIPFFEDQYLKKVEFYDDAIADHPRKKEMGIRIGHAFFANLRQQISSRSDIGEQEIQELGKAGFAWRFLPALLNADSTVLAFGIGTDISFEIALAGQFGCTVDCLDPTPQALEYALPIARTNPRIRVHPVGIFARDMIARFYKPLEKTAGSLSAINLTYSKVFLEAPVKRLVTIMREQKIERVDYLKIDIEGAEHGVIDDMLFSGVDVVQLGVEFDQPIPPWKIEATISKLMLAGYSLVDIWSTNCLFVKRSALTGDTSTAAA